MSSVTARWMWADPAVTCLGPRSARCNPLRWSRRRSLAATAEDFAELQGNDRYRKCAVLVETSDGQSQIYDDVCKAMAALTRRRAKPTDWILVKKADGIGQKWLYVPDIVKTIQKNRLSNIDEDDEMLDSLKRDPLLVALDAQNLEIVFASMKRSHSSPTSSTLSSPSFLSSSVRSSGSKHRSRKLSTVCSDSSLASLEAFLRQDALHDAHPCASRSNASEGSTIAH